MAYMLKQKVLAQIHELMEKGMTAEEIAKKLQEDREKSLQPPEAVEEEAFSSEVKTISQPMAFRFANLTDIVEIQKLLNSAYQPEIVGNESFRTGTGVSMDIITTLFSDASYRWLVLESPSGFGEESDGMILGVSCFSVDGISRRNGIVEGNLGSIRYFGVLPRFHGLCVGLRLLERTEKEMTRENCCRCMVSIPSTRNVLIDWIIRKGYEFARELPYPKFEEDTIHRHDTKLLCFVKSLPVRNVIQSSSAQALTAEPQPTPVVRKATRKLVASDYITETIQNA